MNIIKPWEAPRLSGRKYRAPHAGMPRLARFWSVRRRLMAPVSWDVDAVLANVAGISITEQMFANDQYGDCVMAAQANWMMRAIGGDTGQVPAITDAEVVAAYLAQSGGADSGLVPDASFAILQQQGWVAGGQLRKIMAFGRANAADDRDVALGISVLDGLLVGGDMPIAYSDLLAAGEPWDAPKDPQDPAWQLGSWGGHEMYAVAFNSAYVTLVTWSRRQLITRAGFRWLFAERNYGEAAALVRVNQDDTPVDGLDVATMQADLQAIVEE